MANNNGWYMNSLPLKFLFHPFKTAYVFFVIVLLIFGSSMIAQTYFHQPSLLQQEIQQMSSGSLNSKADDVNIQVAKISYSALNTLFFDWTYINTALKAQKESDSGYQFKQVLLPYMEVLRHFDETLKVISIRLGNISLFIGLSIIFFVVACIDGLTMRAIRQKNASRESAGIYHRAKYWRVGITWLSILIYLSLPISINPYWLIFPISFVAIMIFLQAKYLKKYL